MGTLDLSMKVEEIFKDLETRIREFKCVSGIRCVEGCTECCKDKPVYASPLEFLPAAFELLSGRDREIWIERVFSAPLLGPCVFLKDKALERRGCSIYEKRGLICRLFGFSYGKDKEGNPILLACRHIKERSPTWISPPPEKRAEIILASDYGMRLLSVDPVRGRPSYPINEAIQKSFEMVGFYHRYREAC